MPLMELFKVAKNFNRGVSNALSTDWTQEVKRKLIKWGIILSTVGGVLMVLCFILSVKGFISFANSTTPDYTVSNQLYEKWNECNSNAMSSAGFDKFGNLVSPNFSACDVIHSQYIEARNKENSAGFEFPIAGFVWFFVSIIPMIMFGLGLCALNLGINMHIVGFASDILDEGLSTDNYDEPYEQVQWNRNNKRTKYCPNCGAELSENTRFCPHCGNKL